MTRLRVTDRTTDEVLADLDPDETPATAQPSQASQASQPPQPPPPGERPLVLPGAAPSTTRGRRAVEVVVAGWRFDLEVQDADLADLRARATAGDDDATHHGPTEVRAIIPGRVVSVAVTAGDVVTAGQRLLAVEAMKMENELRAPRAGTVDRVAVAVGQTVELGDVLVEIS
jgi:biotin carboxyl carrier protein